MASLDMDALRMVASGNLSGAREHMDKMLEKQRQRDIKEWIKDNVDLTVYDYEPLEPKKAAEFLDAVRVQLARPDNDIDDPIEILKDKLFDYLDDLYLVWRLTAEREAAEKLSETFGMPSDEALDWISEYAGVSFPIDDYLNDSYETVVMMDTGDSDYDFSLNNVEPAYGGDPIEDISDKASLVWLAEQNGYPKDEFIRLMQLKAEDVLPSNEHPFIHSVYQEIENTSSSLNGVVFLGDMSLAELAKAQKEGVTIPKRTPCGLFDGTNGAGGPLEVELQKDIVVPADVTFSILPDSDFRLRYGVDQTYGLSDKAWKTPLFAGEAKEYEPEVLEQAQKLFDDASFYVEPLSAERSMEKIFAVNLKRNLMNAKEYPFYKGMLDRGQLCEASCRALSNVEAATRMDGREEFRFSERHLNHLLEVSPVKIPQEVVDSHLKHFELLNSWKNGR